MFHHLPKVQKNHIPVQGRPIVAGIGSLLERLGEWVDEHLQPLVTRLPGYLRDTGHLLAHIHEMKWSATSAHAHGFGSGHVLSELRSPLDFPKK